MKIEGYKVIAPLAYIGKKGCTDPRCRRRIGDPDCFGYHCSYCDAPCGSQGHRCDASVTLTEAAERIAKENS